MTLLVLDLHAPAVSLVHSEGQLQQQLLMVAPRLLPYLMSFLTLGIFWNGQQVQLHHFEASDRHLTWIHFGFLLFVSLMPFSTQLLAQFICFRTALLIYWFNILMLGVWLLFSWKYATKAKLLHKSADAEVSKAVLNRIYVAQLLYAASATLCVVSTYLSIGLIVLIQLDYVFAPRFRSRTKPTK